MAGSVVGLDGHRAQAVAFLIDAYDGVRRPPGKGLSHAQAVADVLRESGYGAALQLARGAGEAPRLSARLEELLARFA